MKIPVVNGAPLRRSAQRFGLIETFTRPGLDVDIFKSLSRSLNVVSQ